MWTKSSYLSDKTSREKIVKIGLELLTCILRISFGIPVDFRTFLSTPGILKSEG